MAWSEKHNEWEELRVCTAYDYLDKQRLLSTGYISITKTRKVASFTSTASNCAAPTLIDKKAGPTHPGRPPERFVVDQPTTVTGLRLSRSMLATRQIDESFRDAAKMRYRLEANGAPSEPDGVIVEIGTSGVLIAASPDHQARLYADSGGVLYGFIPMIPWTR